MCKYFACGKKCWHGVFISALFQYVIYEICREIQSGRFLNANYVVQCSTIFIFAFIDGLSLTATASIKQTLFVKSKNGHIIADESVGQTGCTPIIK